MFPSVWSSYRSLSLFGCLYHSLRAILYPHLFFRWLSLSTEYYPSPPFCDLYLCLRPSPHPQPRPQLTITVLPLPRPCCCPPPCPDLSPGKSACTPSEFTLLQPTSAAQHYYANAGSLIAQTGHGASNLLSVANPGSSALLTTAISALVDENGMTSSAALTPNSLDYQGNADA